MFELCSNMVLNIGDITINNMISRILNNNINGIMGRTIFLLLILFSLINLDIAIGSPREHSVMNRLNVGSISE